ncbi:OmpA family protein [Flavobacterium psychraquaticum]|uniref:OmpA family protein n=1 Tax=Flavobacterium psychraquaticum TaxID=3103958 RepID=UPI002ACDDE88|nr:OmpA family protein [Flavobacterium sp. LB-N7T]
MKTKYIFIILIGMTFSTFGQSAKLKTADKKYERYSYIDAIEIYEKVAEKGYKSVDLFEKLGNSYYFNGDLDKAGKAYEELFALSQDVDSEYYFRYAQTLKSQEKYEMADEYMAKFNQKTSDSRGRLYAQNKDYIKDINAVSGKYAVDNTAINSEFYDYGPSFFGKKLVFTSSRIDGNTNPKIHDWTKQNFTDLFVTSIDNEGKLGAVENFSNEINTKFNESSPIFTKDGKTMYFTRNNYNNGKKRKSNDKVSILEKIYKAELVDGKWTNVTELPFCNDNYSTAHPALSPDDKTMYFASDMPGTYGLSDLFKVTIDANGKFGTPENLGATINTEGRETFPFVDADNNLFFASNGHPGLGGLDIFEAKYVNKQFQNPENVGKPINSPKDDFGYVNRDKLGFFSSNRNGGAGYDDIYSFKICTHKLSGIITDIDTKKVLPNSKVIIFDNQMKQISETNSSETGYYEFEINCDKQYYVRASKEEYETTEKIFEPVNEKGESKLNIELKRNIIPIEEGTDLAKVLNISIIYFDLDKWNIRPDAALDLEKIIAVMKQYPSMIIDIRSHTDSRQTHKYNELLSDRRAKSTLEFMVKNGIERKRLTAKGFGESKLINDCSDGVPCTETEHQQNRRSEFIVIKM